MGAQFFPNGNIGLAVLIATIGAMFTTSVYAMLTAAMPRSGGDYTYVSRILHPSIGFAGNFNWAFLNIFWVASDGLLLVYMIGIMCYGLSVVTGNAALMAIGTALSLDLNTIAAALIVTIIASGLVAAAGIKWCTRIQLVGFAVSVLGLIVAIGFFGSTANPDFIAKYDSVMGQNAYVSVIDAAKNAGFVPGGGGDSFVPTLGIAAMACMATLYGMFSTFIGGEVKNAGSLRTQMKAMLGTTVFSGVSIAIVGFLVVYSVGQDYLGAVNYILYADPAHYPFLTAPYYNLLGAIASNNAWIALILGLSFLPIGVIWCIGCTLVATRCMFAWSFDRVVPSQIAYVHPRTRSPVVASVIVIIVATILGVLLVYNQALYYMLFGSIAGTLFSMIAVMIAGIIFPYRRKDIFDKSPSAQKVGGIPLVSILSLIGLVFLGIFLYFYLAYPEIGFWAPMSVTLFVGVWVVGFAIYAVSYLIRKRQGIDLGMLFREIPPA
jgi:amino acid transporter